MATTTDGVPPPPYERREQPESVRATTNSLFDRIQATVDVDYGRGDGASDPVETKRLRDTVLQALSWDYNVDVHGLVLRRGFEDCEHYLEMHDILRNIRSVHGRAHLASHERSALAPYFWKFLHAPCKSLGIPVESAVEIVLRHARYIGNNDRYPKIYAGCVDSIIRDYGMQKLAEKLWMDQNILTPRVATSDEMRLRFTAGIQKVMDKYFVSVRTRVCVEATQHEGQSLSLGNFGVSYTLNDLGMAFEESRREAIERATDPTVSLVEEVRMCMCILGRDVETVEPPPRKFRLFTNKINSYTQRLCAWARRITSQEINTISW